MQQTSDDLLFASCPHWLHCIDWLHLFLFLVLAEDLVGSINSSEGRKLRKRAAPTPLISPKKTPLKKARTMVNTAKVPIL